MLMLDCLYDTPHIRPPLSIRYPIYIPKYILFIVPTALTVILFFVWWCPIFLSQLRECGMHGLTGT